MTRVRGRAALSLICHCWYHLLVTTVGAESAQCTPRTSIWFQAAVRTTDILIAFGGSMNHRCQHRPWLQQDHRPRRGPWWQYNPDISTPLVAAQVPHCCLMSSFDSLHSLLFIAWLVFLSHHSAWLLVSQCNFLKM